MSKKFKQVEHVHFVVTGSFLDVIFNGGSVTLESGYFDHAGALGNEGKYVEYVHSKNKEGKDVPKRYRFDESLRRLMSRKSDVDIHGISQTEFLSNHPQCEGSPNGNYNEQGEQQGVVFRLMDSAKDAGVALDAEEIVLKAKMSAFNLDDATLTEIANILGHYGPADQLMKLKVVEFAGKRPSEYNELLNSGDRPFRAIIRRAIKEGEFTQKGKLIMWDNFMVGADEDAAILTLSKDSKMVDSLKDKLQLSELKTPVKKVPPGKPSKAAKKALKEAAKQGARTDKTTVTADSSL